MKSAIFVAMISLMLPTLCFANDVQGRLKEVYADFITITYQADESKSNDVNRNPAGELKIDIDSQTGFDNFQKLSDLVEGDLIGIDYRPGASKKVAEHIVKIAPEPPAEIVTQQQTTTTTTTVTTANSATPSAY